MYDMEVEFSIALWGCVCLLLSRVVLFLFAVRSSNWLCIYELHGCAQPGSLVDIIHSAPVPVQSTASIVQEGVALLLQRATHRRGLPV